MRLHYASAGVKTNAAGGFRVLKVSVSRTIYLLQNGRPQHESA
jgi:hypothetical protein